MVQNFEAKMNKNFGFVLVALLVLMSGCSGDDMQDQQTEGNSNVDLYLNSVNEMPFPIGGMSAINRKVVYPKSARKAGVQGIVFIKTYINADGAVTKTEIIKGIGSGCDAAAEKAIRETKFSPGRMYGEPVNVQVIVPVRFELL